MVKIIAGLGNPDEKYSGTRHNIGFMVLDGLAEKLGAVFQPKFDGLLAITDAFGHKLYLLKPLTYMNLSGVSVGGLASFYKIPPEDVFVVHDEMNIPFGELKIRHDGSAGGHNGLSSIISHIGSGFPRLKMGIGRGLPGNDVSHVLGKFNPEEKKSLDDFINKGKDAVLSVLKDGLEKTMSVYNRK